jgi:S-DNA-T family DNA segregation ATPase FtsK/SpoIIIE
MGGMTSTYALSPGRMLAAGDPPQTATAGCDRTAAVLTGVFDQHDVDARVAGYQRGPTVTRYEVEVGYGTRVAAVTRLAGDIAYALGTSTVRVLAPVEGKSAIGVETPNEVRDTVTLGDVLPRDGGPLMVGLGRDMDGQPVTADLAAMPHLLIGGATGAGKSVAVNAIITSVLARAAPAQVRLVLVDPKRVELAAYAGVPHLWQPIVTDPQAAVGALRGVAGEMDRRYRLLQEARCRNIAAYNARAAEPLPYLLVVVDELADLMMVAGKAVEAQIVRITQLGRAAGVHMVVATQRPSVNVITGLIKANISSRLAFTVASMPDSRVILDVTGAQHLTGKGDALFAPAGAPVPVRMQGAWVSDAEIDAVTGWWRAQTVTRQAAVAAPARDLAAEAAVLVTSTRFGSTSMVARKLCLSMTAAREVMAELERRGVVGPLNGSLRPVLVQAQG